MAGSSSRGFQRNGKHATVPSNLHRWSPASSSTSSASSGDQSGQLLVPPPAAATAPIRRRNSDSPLPSALFDQSASAAAANSTTTTSASINTSIVMYSLLHQLCSFYEQDPELRDRLVQVVCSKMRLFSDVPSLFEPQFASLRSHYQHGFVRLIKLCQGTLSSVGVAAGVASGPAAQMGLPDLSSRPLRLLTTSVFGHAHVSEESLYQNSRYENEFEELAFLAKGGFGSVYSARNKLDNCEYAIKKILLKYCDPDLFAKIFREVTTLARLHHPNVVNYKTAWMEPYVRRRSRRQSAHQSNGHVNGNGGESDTSSSLPDDDEEGEENEEMSYIVDDDSRYSVSSATNAMARARLEDDSTSYGIVFEPTDDDADAYTNGVEIDSASYGIVFEASEADSSDGPARNAVAPHLLNRGGGGVSSSDPLDIKGAGRPRPRVAPPGKKVLLPSRMMSNNVVSILELEELDTLGEEDENTPPNVVRGLANTPPDKIAAGPLKFSLSPPPISVARKADPTAPPNGKFWVGDNNENDEGGEDEVDSTGDSARVSAPSVRTAQKSAYWATSLVSQQAILASNTIARCREAVSVRVGRMAMAPPAAECAAPLAQDRAVLYLQMQLCENTLRDWLDTRNSQEVDDDDEADELANGDGDDRKVNVADNIAIFRQILSGVEYIHSQGVIHRDLKPRNIFLSKNNQVQIGDFGLAKEDIQKNAASQPETPVSGGGGGENGGSDGVLAQKQMLFRTGSFHTSGVGTQAYGAPEQLAQGLIDDKSDIYSLGIVLLELYAPFSTGMERSVAIRDLRERHLCPEGLVHRHPQIADLIERMTSPLPSLRPTARELLAGTFSEEAKVKMLLERELADARELCERQREENARLRELLAERDRQIAALTVK